ncbi:MAG: hypothetical protein K2W97_07080 [Chthoniobacterales bacterium]|nr:hypothetical protein [Chthoniobacterales bacterium]
MFSKIVSQFFFTCSTFLLLSASLFSMGRGEGPGEKKKDPDLSTEQKTEMSRRAEESSKDEEADPSDALARSMGGCQLGDTTISHSVQERFQQPSSLQPSGSSGMDDGMSAIIPFMDSPAGRVGASVSVTSGEEEQMKQAKMGEFGAHTIQEVPNFESGKASIITPSPTKRSLQLGPTNLNDPQKLFASPAKIIKVDPDAQAAKMAERAEQRAKIQQAILHGNQIAAYAEATKKAIVPVYRVFKSIDRKKTDPLTSACQDRIAAQMAMKMAVDDLNDFLSQAEQHSEIRVPDQKLMLKLALATTAIHETTENVKAVAEGFKEDTEYKDAVNGALLELQAVHNGGSRLFNAIDSHTQPLQLESALAFLHADKKEALQTKIQTAEATLQYATELMGPVIDPARRVFSACDGEEKALQCGEELLKNYQQLKAEIALMKAAINQAKKHFESEDLSEQDDRFVNALDVTTDDVSEVVEKIRDIVDNVREYDGWSMGNVPAILKNSAAIYQRYQTSLAALGSR